MACSLDAQLTASMPRCALPTATCSTTNCGSSLTFLGPLTVLFLTKLIAQSQSEACKQNELLSCQLDRIFRAAHYIC